jgi:hypothetical protein
LESRELYTLPDLELAIDEAIEHFHLIHDCEKECEYM